MNNPRLLVALLVGLVLLIIGVALAKSGLSGDDYVSLLAVGMMATLMSSFVLAQMRGSLTNTLRDLVIWGMIVAAVTLAYANKAKFGF